MNWDIKLGSSTKLSVLAELHHGKVYWNYLPNFGKYFYIKWEMNKNEWCEKSYYTI